MSGWRTAFPGVTGLAILLVLFGSPAAQEQGRPGTPGPDGAKAPEAAEALGLTADKLIDLGIVDGIIKEPLGGAHRDPKAVARDIGDNLTRALAELSSVPGDRLQEERYDRLRRIGVFATTKESDDVSTPHV